MRRLRSFAARLQASLGLHPAAGADFDDEVESHLGLHTDDLLRSGLPHDEARRLARARVGSRTALEEAHRDQRRLRPLDTAARDVRHGLRLLWRSPLFTAVAVLLLGLGIGATATVFTLANALMLRALPVASPERLALLANDSWTYPIFEALRQADLGVDGIAAWANEPGVVEVDGRSERDEVQFVSGRFFEVLGVGPMIGRTIRADDDRRGGGAAGPVAVISHAYWQRRLSGDPDVLSRALVIDGFSLAIVGVMPPGFHGPEVGRAFDVAIPFGIEPLLRGEASALDARSTWWLNVMLRLAPGQTLASAQERLRAVQPMVRRATMPAHYLAEHQGEYLSGPFELTAAATGRSPMRGRYRQPLLILGLTAGLVLLVACANLANLLLARGAARRSEMSMRLALGASRLRLVGQLLVEGLLLSAAGALVGLAVAWASSRVILGLLSAVDRPVHLDLTLDWRVLAFTATAACVTALLCALMPALRATRVAPGEAVKEQSRSVAGEARAAFVRQLPAISATVPGVAGATLSSFAPMSGAGWNGAVATIDGRALPGTDRERLIWHNAVETDFFRTYGTPLLAGRAFSDTDTAGAPPVAIVNDAFVQRFLPEGDPIGRVVSDGFPDSPARVIVGRVADARYFRDLRREPPATMYLPHRQLDEVGGRVVVSVRATDDRLAPLRQALASRLERAGQPVTVRTQMLADFVDGAVSQERTVATVAGFFGVLALVIAGVGLYGVTAYSVTRRQRELGIRLALGAKPWGIVGLVIRRAGALVLVGVLAGLGLALWVGTFVEALLHGVTPADPGTLVTAVGVLASTAVLAATVPAWRAARTDPAAVLKSQ